MCTILQGTTFGFVYEAPPHSRPAPRSLLRLLHGQPAPIKHRVTLGRKLSTSLLCLHAVNWLHKGFKSEAILFFTEPTRPNLQDPVVSGFEYARPDRNDDTATGAPISYKQASYCHPDYIGRPDRFRKSYDIYSLGIILLEIALWKPITEIFGGLGDDDIDHNKCDALKIRQRMTANRDRLLDNMEVEGEPGLLEQVRDAMGDRYHDAVKACIGGMEYFKLPTRADQTDPVIATLLQEAYLRLVVDVLHGVSV